MILCICIIRLYTVYSDHNAYTEERWNSLTVLKNILCSTIISVVNEGETQTFLNYQQQ